MTSDRTVRDTHDDPPLFLEERIVMSAPATVTDDDLREEETTTEPVPAPVFLSAIRRLCRAVVLGSALVSASILLAAWWLR